MLVVKQHRSKRILQISKKENNDSTVLKFHIKIRVIQLKGT